MLYRDCQQVEFRIESALEAYNGGDSEKFRSRLSKVRERLERVVAIEESCLRSIEDRLIHDWLAGGMKAEVDFIAKLKTFRKIRAAIEEISERKAATRLKEALRLATEIEPLVCGTPFESDRFSQLFKAP